MLHVLLSLNIWSLLNDMFKNKKAAFISISCIVFNSRVWPEHNISFPFHVPRQTPTTARCDGKKEVTTSHHKSCIKQTVKYNYIYGSGPRHMEYIAPQDQCLFLGSVCERP